MGEGGLTQGGGGTPRRHLAGGRGGEGWLGQEMGKENAAQSQGREGGGHVRSSSRGGGGPPQDGVLREPGAGAWQASRVGGTQQEALRAKAREGPAKDSGVECKGKEQRGVFQPRLKGPPIPYTPAQRVLLVGEGDFSFARGLLRRFGAQGQNLVATCLDSRDQLLRKYDGAGDTLEELTAGGVQVRFEVDAVRLAQTLQVSKKKQGSREDVLRSAFDRIVFNLPLDGVSNNRNDALNIQKNRSLLSAFFLSALPLLARDGEIHVTLKACQPYRQWNIVAMAQQSRILKLKSTEAFLPHLYPGYTQTQAYAFADGVSAESKEEVAGKAMTYIFSKHYMSNE